MTDALPSLEEPEAGTCCPRCAEMGVRVEIHVLGFCADCYEREMSRLEAIERQRTVRADFERARARTRAWKHSRAVQA